MIVPRGRLLWGAGFTLVPLSLAPVAAPALLPPLAGLAALLLSVVLLDALLSAGRDRGIAGEFPEKVSLSRGREGHLEFALRDDRGRPLALRVGLGLPPGLESPRAEERVLLPAGGEPLRLRWPLESSRRGAFDIERCHVCIPSPLGFWERQGTLSAGIRVEVHTDLLSEQRKLAALFLHRGEAGLHPQRQLGQGREFEKLREYLPGDSLGDIHWKTTAKRGYPVTKQYQIERTQEVYVLVDASRLSARPSGGMEGSSPSEPVLERYLAAALTLGLVARQQGDLFGLLGFGDRVLRFLRAGAGQAHFAACREALFDLQPQAVSPDFTELATFVNLRLRRRSLLLILTSLDDPALAESFLRSVGALAERHLVLVGMPRPADARPVFEGPPAGESAEIYRRLGGHLLWHNLRELEKVLRQRGVGFSLIDHDRLSADLVSRYLAVKRRQIL